MLPKYLSQAFHRFSDWCQWSSLHGCTLMSPCPFVGPRLAATLSWCVPPDGLVTLHWWLSWARASNRSNANATGFHSSLSWAVLRCTAVNVSCLKQQSALAGAGECKGQIADVSVSLYCATVLSSYEGPILVSYQNQKCNLHPNCVHCPQL